MSRDLIQQLKKLPHSTANPRSEWVKHNRELLVSQIKNTLPEQSVLTWGERARRSLAIFFPKSIIIHSVRPIAVLLLIALAAPSLYYGTVKASEESLPGEGLYQVKRSAEKIQETLVDIVGDTKAQTNLHLSFAHKRAAEITKLVRGAGAGKATKVAATVADLKNEIKTINTKLEETTGPASQAIPAATVQDVKQNSEQIKDVLQEIKNNLLVSATTEDKKISEAVSEVKSLASDTSVKAMEVLVAKHLTDGTVSKEEVKRAINSTLENAVSEVGESKQTAAGAQTIVDAITSEVKDLTGEMGKKQNSGSFASSTKEFTDQISNVADQTKEAALKTEAVSVQVNKTATEARELLGSGDLAKAVDKIKEVNQATKQAEKISDGALETAQTALPIAQVIKNAAGLSSSSTPSLIVPADFNALSVSGSAAFATTTTTNTLRFNSTTLYNTTTKLLLTPPPATGTPTASTVIQKLRVKK